MRQNDFIFDIDKKQIGIARANCSADPVMIADEAEYSAYGQPYPHAGVSIKEKDLEKEMEKFHQCQHNSSHV